MAGDLLDALSAHLVDEGIARQPNDAVSPAVPLWLEPKNGVPAPGEREPPVRGDDAVLGAFMGGGVVPNPYESELRLDAIRIEIRTLHSTRAVEPDAAIRAALIDRHDWVMGGLYILESQQSRPFERRPEAEPSQGFTFTVAYIFDRRA
jgi:hypothetical protein